MSALTGIPKETSKGSGGIMEVWITELANLTGDTTIVDGVASMHTAAGVWKLYVLGKEAGSNFVYTANGDVAAGTIEYDDVLTMIFKRNQVSKRNELKVLGQSELVCVINDNNAPQSLTGDCRVGQTYVIGLPVCTNVGGAELRSGVGSTGTQLAESNNLTITIGVKETIPPPAISEADYLLIRAGSAVG